MDKPTMRSLGHFLKQLDYEGAYKFVEEKKLKINAESALTFFSLCTKSLAESKENFSADYLVKILEKCEFGKLDGEDMTTYIKCIYFLVKTLIEKNEIEAITELRYIIYPDFMSKVKSEKQNSYFRSIWGNLHIYVAKTSKVKILPPANILVNICRICTKIIQELPPENVTSVENYTHFLLQNVPIDKVYDYLLEVFVSISNGQFVVKDQKFKTYKSLLNIISSFVVKDNGIVEEILTESLKAFKVCCDKKLLLFIKATIEILKDDLEVVEGTLQTLILMFNGLKKDEFLQELSGFLISILRIKFKKDWEKTAWQKIMTEGVLMELTELIECLGMVYCKKKITCCCKLEVNSCGSGNYLTLVMNIGKTNLSLNKVYEDYYVSLFGVLERGCRHLEVVKKADCTKFVQLWMEIGRAYYNLAVGLYRDKAYCADVYLQQIIRNILVFEGVENELIAKNVTLTLFEVYIDYYYRLGKFQQGLDISALFFLLYKSEKGLRLFISCKEKLPNSKHQSVVSVLKTKETFYKKIYPDFIPIKDAKVAVEIGMKELEIYKAIWPSRKAITGVYKDLYPLIKPGIFAKCLTKTSVELLVNSQSTIYDIIPNLLIKLKDENFKDNFCLAYIYFIKYKCEIAAAVAINNADMLSKNVEPLVAPKDEVEDENDHCDITADTNSLHMDNFTIIIKSLLLSAKHFLLCNLDEFEEGFLKVLTDLAHTLNLQCFKIEAVQVWIKILEIAESVGAKKFYVEHCGFVLENINIKSELFKKIVNNVEKKFIKEITKEIREDQILLSYFSLKALAYYNSLDYKNCVIAYEQASEHYYELDNSNGVQLETIKAHYLLLKSLILNLPCTNSIERHHEFGLIAPILTYKHLLENLKSRSDISLLNSYFFSLIFEATESLLHMNFWMRFPREVRCYGREVMVLAQKLILPLRTTRLLIYLASADLLSCNYDDCLVKLNDISAILAIKKMKCDKIQRKEMVLKSNINFDEIILECPRLRVDAGSPVLYEEPFSLPNFIQHENCNCIPCTCPEYQVLVLKKIHLDAIFSEPYHNSIPVSDGYFQGCFIIYKRLKELLEEIFGNLDFEVNKTFVRLEEVYNAVRFDYIRQRFRQDFKSEKYRKELKAFPKSTNFYLNTEVDTLQEIISIDLDNLVDKHVMKESPKHLLKVHPTTTVIKTPENKYSEIQIPKANSNATSPVYKIKVAKKILFGLESPQFQVPKTPAGFKIYTPKTSTKKTSKKKENSGKTSSSQKSKSDEFSAPTRRTIRKNLVSDLEEDEKIPSAVKTYKGRGLRSRMAEKDVKDLNSKFDDLLNLR